MPRALLRWTKPMASHEPAREERALCHARRNGLMAPRCVCIQKLKRHVIFLHRKACICDILVEI